MSAAPLRAGAVAAAPASVGAAAFKAAMRALVSGVTVVAAQDGEGFAAGLTATAVTSLSADPPSLLVCVNRASAMSAALQPGASFSVNVLAAGQADVAAAFGGQRGLKGAARFAVGQWSRAASGAPLLRGCLVSFECEAAEIASFATHRVVMARVTDLHAGPAGPALAYRDGRYLSVE